MKILLDENVNTQLPLLKSYLQEKGYDVIEQATLAASAPDLDVLALATQQSRTVISFDGDFSAHRFRDNHPIPYGVIFIEESKHKVNLDDALMTRKIVSVIEGIAASTASNPDILCDTIFTLTQPTPYGVMKIRPKKYKNRKEIVLNLIYVEEQLFAESYATLVSVPMKTEEHLPTDEPEDDKGLQLDLC